MIWDITNSSIYIYSQLSGIQATEGVEAEANHHPLLIQILADEMNVKRMFLFP